MSRDRFIGTPRVFLSYARKDGEEYARDLRIKLQTKQPELTLWRDRAEMEGGVGWWKQIEEVLESQVPGDCHDGLNLRRAPL